MTCTANTRGGRRCRRPALAGREVCVVHSGAKVGRPSKLTDEVEKRICDAVRAGSYLSVAARHAGVSETTLYGWLRLAREDGADPRLVAFAAALDKAEADGEVHTVGIVRREIARGNPRAAFEFLARRHPERWSSHRPPAPAVSPAGEEPEPSQRPDLSRLSDEQLRSLEALYVDKRQDAAEEKGAGGEAG